MKDLVFLVLVFLAPPTKYVGRDRELVSCVGSSLYSNSAY